MTFPYYCKECGAEATVVENRVLRTCDHEDSVIIAERTCTLYGEGGANVLSLAERAAAALKKIKQAVGR